MTEKNSINEVEAIVSEYEASTSAVAEAEKNLETIKAQRDAKKLLAEQKIEELKSKLSTIEESSQSFENTETILDTVSNKVEEKLEEAKDTWAELAKTNPDEARRKLRKFWIITAGSAGILIGGVLGYIIKWIF